MFVLEVSTHSQGACIERSKKAVWCWAALVKDDSGPADVEGLGHMCVLCKVLDAPLALHALSLALSEGEPFTSQSSLVCFVRQMGSDEAGVANHKEALPEESSSQPA